MTRPEHATIAKSLERIAEIMLEPSVVAMRGEAYTDSDTDRIREGIEALGKLDPAPKGYVAQFENEKRLAVVGRAVETSVMLLHRAGFEEVKGEAWTERDRAVIEAGLTAFDRATAYQRG